MWSFEHNSVVVLKYAMKFAGMQYVSSPALMRQLDIGRLSLQDGTIIT